MNKKYTILIVLLTIIVNITLAQNITYSKVKIWLGEKNMQELQAIGVATDHGSYKKDTWFQTTLANFEIAQVQEAGFETEIIIEDMQAFYLERNQSGIIKGTHGTHAVGDCGDGEEYAEVENFELGSMGGFFTYQEMLDNLDDMQAMYPNLISTRTGIGTFETHEDRPIYWVRISNNPTVEDATKPEILYTAIHHAREPASMSQLIYYMWYLLENYDSNPDVKYVVDNTEMFFVPCINPDGYIYNETTNPNGGGMHRKNRRDVGTNNKGVDLNRNYSYEYGGANTSTNPNSDVYRGTGAFSEPETQAMKWFSEQHEFKLALNYHAFADQLLFPWGYDDNIQCDDHDLYTRFTEYLVLGNGYLNQQSSFLYPAAGDSDDWAYGDVSTKPKTLAMTPEVGGDEDDFWPPIGNILSICEENIHQNFGSALLLLDNVETKDLSPAVFEDVSGTIPFEITRLGLQDVDYVVSIEPLDDDFASVGNAAIFSGLSFGDTDDDAIAYTLAPSNIENGTFQYVLVTNTLNYTYRDTITKYFGDTEIEYTDNGGDMVVWQATGDWGADSDAYSAPTSTSDSPSGNYGANENNRLVSGTINLTNATAAFLNFYAKWDIEAGYDYAQVSATIAGQNNWEPLCGNYTKVGNANQDEGEPLYDGVQNNWIQESMSLNDFLGENIQIRYRLVSDGFVDGDGFKFDDMEVVKSIEGEEDTTTNPVDTTTSIYHINEQIILTNIFPNPTNDMAYLSYDIAQLGAEAHLIVYNQLGQVVYEQAISKPQGILEIDTKTFGSGAYLYQLQSVKGNSAVGKLVVY